jgi:hypothetical protein
LKEDDWQIFPLLYLMNGKPGEELYNIYFPIRGITPGIPEHVQIRQPQLPGLFRGDPVNTSKNVFE